MEGNPMKLISKLDMLSAELSFAGTEHADRTVNVRQGRVHIDGVSRAVSWVGDRQSSDGDKKIVHVGKRVELDDGTAFINPPAALDEAVHVDPSSGVSTLMLASSCTMKLSAQLQIVKTLLSHPCCCPIQAVVRKEDNIKDLKFRAGWTALMVAADSAHGDVVRLIAGHSPLRMQRELPPYHNAAVIHILHSKLRPKLAHDIYFDMEHSQAAGKGHSTALGGSKRQSCASVVTPRALWNLVVLRIWSPSKSTSNYSIPGFFRAMIHGEVGHASLQFPDPEAPWGPPLYASTWPAGSMLFCPKDEISLDEDHRRCGRPQRIVPFYTLDVAAIHQAYLQMLERSKYKAMWNSQERPTCVGTVLQLLAAGTGRTCDRLLAAAYLFDPKRFWPYRVSSVVRRSSELKHFEAKLLHRVLALDGEDGSLHAQALTTCVWRSDMTVLSLFDLVLATIPDAWVLQSEIMDNQEHSHEWLLLRQNNRLSCSYFQKTTSEHVREEAKAEHKFALSKCSQHTAGSIFDKMSFNLNRTGTVDLLNTAVTSLERRSSFQHVVEHCVQHVTSSWESTIQEIKARLSCESADSSNSSKGLQHVASTIQEIKARFSCESVDSCETADSAHSV
jgi:hypothetical protein